MHSPKRYKQYWRYILIGWLVVFMPSFSIETISFAASFSNTASYKAYFTPSDDCTKQIIHAIDATRRSIYMHAYSLTSQPIVEALARAHHRKVSVNIIIDKSNLSGNSKAKFLATKGVGVWVDSLSGLSHNKVILADEETVITGSFNFSHAAQHRNRENILIIKDKKLTQLYLQNWYRCQKKSTLLKIKRPQAKRTASRIEQATRTKRIFMGLIATIAIGAAIAMPRS